MCVCVCVCVCVVCVCVCVCVCVRAYVCVDVKKYYYNPILLITWHHFLVALLPYMRLVSL